MVLSINKIYGKTKKYITMRSDDGHLLHRLITFPSPSHGKNCGRGTCVSSIIQHLKNILSFKSEFLIF